MRRQQGVFKVSEQEIMPIKLVFLEKYVSKEQTTERPTRQEKTALVEAWTSNDTGMRRDSNKGERGILSGLTIAWKQEVKKKKEVKGKCEILSLRVKVV